MDGLPPAECRRARERALQILYQWEIGRIDVAVAVEAFEQLDVPACSPPVRALSRSLVRGTVSRLPAIDALITGQAEHWRLERMPVVDRLILRLATFELLEKTAPPPVIIDEALELARTFSTEATVKFVNGVLDAIGQRLRGEAHDTDTNAN